MKQFQSVPSWGLVVAALCLTIGIAKPGLADETTHGTGKPAADAKALHVAPESRGAAVPGTPGRQNTDLFPGGAAKTGRTALNQPGCTICLGGNASAQWSGNSGSFHVDTISNNRSGSSGPLDLKMVLTAAAPVFGPTLNYFSFSDSIPLSSLASGFQYSNVNSGTVSFLGSSIPGGEYFVLMFLRENVAGTYYYVDWIVMDQKVSCNGSACTTVNPPSSCVEDAYTMCLLGGRYRVTGRWKNQYAGGAQANLAKAKLTDVTGAFWIADANTYEFMIRVNTATDNGRAWISILTFTDVEFWVAVTDVTNGQSNEYHSPIGNRTLIFDPFFFVYP